MFYANKIYHTACFKRLYLRSVDAAWSKVVFSGYGAGSVSALMG